MAIGLARCRARCCAWQARNDVVGAQTLTNCLCIVTAVAEHAIRATPGTTALPLQRWDSIDKGERLLRVISVCFCELDCERNTLAVADQMTLAAELGAIVEGARDVSRHLSTLEAHHRQIAHRLGARFGSSRRNRLLVTVELLRSLVTSVRL